MTSLFVLLVVAILLPLILHSWRITVFGLGVQGFLLGLILLKTHQYSSTMVVEAVNLFAVRGFLVPWLLFRVMRNTQLDPSFILIKKSFSKWLLVFVIVLAGATFGRSMAYEDATEAFQVGAAAIAILIGLLIMANQSDLIGQIVGIMTFECGLTLVELLSEHVMPLEVYVGISLIFVLLLLTQIQFINAFKTSSHDDDLLDDGIVL